MRAGGTLAPGPGAKATLGAVAARETLPPEGGALLPDCSALMKPDCSRSKAAAFA